MVDPGKYEGRPAEGLRPEGRGEVEPHVSVVVRKHFPDTAYGNEPRFPICSIDTAQRSSGKPVALPTRQRSAIAA